MAVESSETRITKIPSLSLPDIDGAVLNLQLATRDKVSIIFFSCNHCPYVQWIEQEITAMSRDTPDCAWLAICSNDVVTYPQDDVPGLRDQLRRTSWNFPYLVDSNQLAARAFGAVCTPDFFVFDSNGSLVYRGAIDGSRPRSEVPVTGEFLRGAIAAGRLNQKFTDGRPSLGCSIKWPET